MTVARVGALAAGLIAGGATLASFAARRWWLCELATHFRVQYFWLLALAAFALAVTRARKLALAAAVLAALNGVEIVPLYFGPPVSGDAGPPLRALSLNVHYLNHDYGRTIELVVDELPDVMFLFEITPEWVAALKFLEPEYPYQHVIPIERGGGIALYSRHKIADLSVHHESESGLPTMVAEIDGPGGPLTLLGTHPASPASARDFEFRNRQLEQVARLAHGREGPVMLLGDLNTTSWSPYFRDLVVESGLRDSRRGYGVEASWPGLPTPLLRIPIDHCLVSPSISIRNRRLGPAVGSDHRPLLVDFTVVGD